MTRATANVLKQGGGEFSMRSGAKKQYMELLDDDVRSHVMHEKEYQRSVFRT